MADQRQLFRFRFPWLSAATAPRPTVEAPGPPPAQPTTTIPIQRPPFRPAGIARPQPPQAPAPRAEVQATAPSRTAASGLAPSRVPFFSRVTAQPASPARGTNQIRPAFPPSRVSPPGSPIRVTRSTTLLPSSPSRNFETQPGAQTAPKRPSPSRSEAETIPKPAPPPKQPQKTIEDRPRFPTFAAPPQPLKPASTVEDQKKPSSAARPTKATEKPSGSSALNERKEAKKVKEHPKREDYVGISTKERETQQKRHAMKKPWTTSNTDEKKHDAMKPTHPKDQHKPNHSHPKHVPGNGERVPLQQGIKEDISKLIQRLTTEHTELPMDEKLENVITLASENRGAHMIYGSESGKKDESVDDHRGYKTNTDDSSEETTDGERSHKRKQKPTKDSAAKAYVNSNTQSIINSLMLDSSVTGRNPGVQLVFSHEQEEERKPSPKSEPIETTKDEFNITPAEKLT